MCGFVLYDTQLIIEKRRIGDKDFVWHSVDLFIDFVNIFRYLLIILAQKVIYCCDVVCLLAIDNLFLITGGQSE